MTLRDLVTTLHRWARDHHGEYPPFWVLKSAEFRPIVAEMFRMNLPYPPRSELLAGDVKAFKCLHVTVVEFDGKLPEGSSAFE